MKLTSFPILSLVLALSVTISWATLRKSYGEECSKTQKCDRKGWLACHEGVCACAKIDEMYFDEIKGKCVTKSGERCKYGVDVEEGSGESAYVEITECVPNARCGAVDGLCVCDNQYHEIFNGTCALSSTIGETCAENYECSNAEHLNCLQGVCTCAEGTEYSAEDVQCVGLLHENCVDGKCLYGAECSNSTNGKCSCDSDHYGDGGRCLKRKGVKESCQDDTECIFTGLLKLKCQNGICDCTKGKKNSKVQKTEYFATPGYENYASYHPQFITSEFKGFFIELCAPLVGESCPEGFCVPNSFCEVPNDKKIVEDRYNYGICKCLPEFLPDKDMGKCGRSYESRYGCSTNSDCANNLVCNENRCRCASPQLQTVDSDKESCLSLIGGRCHSGSQLCVQNSSCRLSWNRVTGHCKCNPGFVENKEGKCDGEFGTSCSYGTNFCDKASNLVCLSGKCSCPDSMYIYAGEERKCLGLVGAICKVNNDCVENAECLTSHPNLPARCACRHTFVESVNSTCKDFFMD